MTRRQWLVEVTVFGRTTEIPVSPYHPAMDQWSEEELITRVHAAARMKYGTVDAQTRIVRELAAS
jgi:hypothetical protein